MKQGWALPEDHSELLWKNTAQSSRLGDAGGTLVISRAGSGIVYIISGRRKAIIG